MGTMREFLEKISEMRGHRRWQSSEGNMYFVLDMRIYFIFDFLVLRLVVMCWYTRDVYVRKIYINSFTNGKAAAAGLNFHESRCKVWQRTGCGCVKQKDIHRSGRSGITQLGKPEKPGGFVAQLPFLFSCYFSKLYLLFNWVKSAVMRSKRLSLCISFQTCILRSFLGTKELISSISSVFFIASWMWIM